MGYCSQVVIVAESNTTKELKALIESEKANGNYWYEYDTETKEKGDVTIFAFNWVKWYSDNAECFAFRAEALLCKIDEEHYGEDGWNFSFTRIGEDCRNGDVERWGDISFGFDNGVSIDMHIDY